MSTNPPLDLDAIKKKWSNGWIGERGQETLALISEVEALMLEGSKLRGENVQLIIQRDNWRNGYDTVVALSNSLRARLENAKEALATIHARAKLETPQIDQRWLAAKCEVILAELEKP